MYTCLGIQKRTFSCIFSTVYNVLCADVHASLDCECAS